MAKGKKKAKQCKKKKLSQNRRVRILKQIDDARYKLFVYSHHPNVFSSKTLGTPIQIRSAQENLERCERKLQ